MCISNISQVTNVEIFKKERVHYQKKIIIIITKKESDVRTNSNDDQYCCVYKYGNVIACARISLN